MDNIWSATLYMIKSSANIVYSVWWRLSLGNTWMTFITVTAPPWGHRKKHCTLVSKVLQVKILVLVGLCCVEQALVIQCVTSAINKESFHLEGLLTHWKKCYILLEDNHLHCRCTDDLHLRNDEIPYKQVKILTQQKPKKKTDTQSHSVGGEE